MAGFANSADNPFRMPPEADLSWVFKPDDQKKTKAQYQWLAQSKRQKIDLIGKVVRGKRCCLASFPGSFHKEWEEYSMKCLGTGFGSIACVFLNGKNFGEHAKNPEDGKRCYCHTLYGKEEAWGCQWFELWAANIEEAVEDGQRLVVVCHSGQKDKDAVEWKDLSSKRGALPGLGTSQKCEVAWLKKKGFSYECIDISQWESYTDGLATKDRRKEVWERPTAASKGAATKRLKDAELPMAQPAAKLQKQLDDMRSRVLETAVPDDTFLTTIATKPAVGVCNPLKSEERDLRQYITQKREVFLVQMALDVKKTEVVRLDEKAQMKEAALLQSEEMLAADTRKFEEFLQERYEKAQKVIKEAENFGKDKQTKIMRIKGMKQQIAGLQSDIGKSREVKEESARYAEFLVHKLTPADWKQQQKEIKLNRKEQRRKDWIRDKFAPFLAKTQDDEAAVHKAAEDDKPSERSFGKKAQQEAVLQAQRQKERAKKLKQLEKRKVDDERKIADSYADETSEEEPELHFKEPKQLMNTFTELEEKNLSLIQGTHETEQSLDELTQNFGNNRDRMSNKVGELNETIRNLQANIAQEKRQVDTLQKRMAEKCGTESQDKKLAWLTHLIHAVYLNCGLPDEHNPEILQMLGSIESKLEELIHGLDEAHQTDGDLVLNLEKMKDKERRERIRVLRQNEQTEKQEERLKASLKRSQMPVFKKAGKQVMYRSPPLHKEKKVVTDNTDAEVHAQDHGIFGMYIDRKTNQLQTSAPVIEDPKAKATARAMANMANLGATGQSMAGTGAKDAIAAALFDGEDPTLDTSALALADPSATAVNASA